MNPVGRRPGGALDGANMNRRGELGIRQGRAEFVEALPLRGRGTGGEILLRSIC